MHRLLLLMEVLDEIRRENSIQFKAGTRRCRHSKAWKWEKKTSASMKKQDQPTRSPMKSDEVNGNSEGNVDPRKQIKAITLGTMVHSPIIVSCPCGTINNQ